MQKNFIFVVLVFLAGMALFLLQTSARKKQVQSFVQCVEAGFPVQESYPRRCTGPDGKTFSENVNSPNSAEGAPSGSLHNLPVPEAVAKVRSTLAKREQVAEDQVVILEALEKKWPNSCLGIAEPGLMCAQVITQGYQIRATAKGKEFNYRTNSTGSVIKEE